MKRQSRQQKEKVCGMLGGLLTTEAHLEILPIWGRTTARRKQGIFWLAEVVLTSICENATPRSASK